ncbi:GntP family permease [Proteiniclasticum sp. BAD-10]|uniref:GntP family permease n=1 Tax=Proteiniclasticum sediminis TaxID=2804028 RepID=A0A941CRT1_9CLOT|nr:GntP family permease [Proteiniclasticum sediminis]MBR0576593.1 GntP family permease [Proteiniclasticum sediminis]
MLSLFGIFLGLALLMFLAYKGYSIVWVAPLTAAVVALLGGLNVLDAYMGPYMEGLVGFVKSWFPAFMLSAIFGNLMDYTGSAKAIAIWLTKTLGSKSAISAIILGCAVLTFGGVSLFVVVFAIYPLALAIFREANISRKLIPGAIAAGAFTFTMTAVPGTPQIQNLIPMKYFGTSPTAAPIMGLTATAILFFGSVFYLEWKKRKLESQGEVFTEPDAAHAAAHVEEKDLPNVLLAIIPLLWVIIILNFVPSMIGLKASDPKNIIIALLTGIFVTMILNFKKRSGFIAVVGKGAQGSIGAILNTAAAVGFGTVVKTVPGFAELTNILLSIPGSPLISLSVAVNLLAGATGSASGGMGIALEALGSKYMDLATQNNINPAAFHRIASLSSGGLDTLPHNGAVLTLLNNTGMSHKDSYIDIMVTSLILPVVATIPAIILASLGIY